MKWTLVLLLLIFTGTGCIDGKREKEIQEREIALKQKEQELILKEESLRLREDDLVKREQGLDSTATTDSSQLIDPALVGSWSVVMTCTEATCPGSAVGDIKKEQWDISYQNNTLIAKAMAGEKLVRVYTGAYSTNGVELVDDKTSIIQPAAKMVVRLTQLDSTRMTGQREIIRETDCRVVFDIKMQKQ